MPKVENHAESPFHFPVIDGKRADGAPNVSKTIIFPRAMLKTDEESGEAAMEPGVVTISDDVLAAMKKDDVARSWFTPRKLVVVADSAKEGAPAKK